MCNKHYNTANMYRYVRTGCNQDNWCKTDMINSLFYNTNSIFENSNFCNTYNIQGYNDPFYDNKGNCKMGAMIGYGIFSWAIQAFSPLIRNKII